MIRTATGNLLLSDADALVNTVNCVGVMGKGIALQFKDAWPGMYKDYRRAAKAEQVVPGRMHVYETGKLIGPRYIVNFPTKRHWRARSRLADIDAGLLDLVRQIERLGIKSIAVPPLGVGNGGLDWSVVRPRIVAALEPLSDVDVRLYEPGPPPSAAERPVGTKRPKMTSARAVVLAAMGRYGILDYELTQLEVQKLAYFLQLAGEPLDLRYERHHYGPYADRLYHLLRHMEGHQVVGVMDRSPRATIRLQPGALEEAERFLADRPDTKARFERVARLIEGFETPFGMELLASVHKVASDDPSTGADSETCTRAVRTWSRRKANLMRPHHVAVALDRLVSQGWLAESTV